MNFTIKHWYFTTGTVRSPTVSKSTLNIDTPSKAMPFPSELKFHFNCKEHAKKFYYVCENVVVKTNTKEEKSNNLVAYLDGEVFEYYFDNFTEDNVPNEEANHFGR